MRNLTGGPRDSGLEHVPKKVNDFFDKDMLSRFEVERFLSVVMSPSDWKTL
jgi:hypothetical protein